MPRSHTAREPSPVPRGDTGPEHVEPDAIAESEVQDTEMTDHRAGPAFKPGTAWSRRRRIVIAVLAVLVVAAAAGTWYLANQPAPADVRPAVAKDGTYTPGSIPSDAGAAAVRMAIDEVPKALSYDYRSLDRNLAEATEGMTPEFTNTFTDTFNRVVKPMATENKAVTQALVRGAGLANLSDDETTATCVLFVDQLLVTSKRKSGVEPQVGKERVRVTLNNADGTWQIDDIQPF